MKQSVKIALCEPSAVVRAGVAAILRHSSSLQYEITEIDEPDKIRSFVSRTPYDIIVVSPLFTGAVNLNSLRKESANEQVRIVALVSSLFDRSLLSGYDEAIYLSDPAEAIKEKVGKLTHQPASVSSAHSLSQREKEVLICLIKGMTNKETADNLCISTHTVITHRRNISAKLKIHSTAGLTIYAIVNKLVDLDTLNSAEVAD